MNFLDLKNVQERPTNKSKEAEWQKAQIKMALSKKPWLLIWLAQSVVPWTVVLLKDLQSTFYYLVPNKDKLFHQVLDSRPALKETQIKFRWYKDWSRLSKCKILPHLTSLLQLLMDQGFLLLKMLRIMVDFLNCLKTLRCKLKFSSFLIRESLELKTCLVYAACTMKTWIP